MLLDEVGTGVWRRRLRGRSALPADGCSGCRCVRCAPPLPRAPARAPLPPPPDAGTDPAEGSALGIALLRALVQGGPGGAGLVAASTHHGALTSLKYEDTRFENASVEFDEVKLAPTYRRVGAGDSAGLTGRCTRSGPCFAGWTCPARTQQPRGGWPREAGGCPALSVARLKAGDGGMRRRTLQRAMLPPLGPFSAGCSGAFPGAATLSTLRSGLGWTQGWCRLRGTGSDRRWLRWGGSAPGSDPCCRDQGCWKQPNSCCTAIAAAVQVALPLPRSRRYGSRNRFAECVKFHWAPPRLSSPPGQQHDCRAGGPAPAG